MNMKLEVVIVPVSDVGRAKKFYQKLGWRVDGDFDAGENLRVVQVTPPRSNASIIFGKGITSARPGSASSLVLAVDNIDAARAELMERGAKVSEVFHYAGLPFNESGDKTRISGRDPEGRTYFTFVSFDDPDGNPWLVQEITTRLPGREWERQNAAAKIDVGRIAQLLRETSEHHDGYEKTHAEHHWWDWYAPYFSARQNGSSSEEAVAAANRYMDETFHVPAK
jgi:predicted enzyme related to lactoylglutathione lyase